MYNLVKSQVRFTKEALDKAIVYDTQLSELNFKEWYETNKDYIIHKVQYGYFDATTNMWTPTRHMVDRIIATIVSTLRLEPNPPKSMCAAHCKNPYYRQDSDIARVLNMDVNVFDYWLIRSALANGCYHDSTRDVIYGAVSQLDCIESNYVCSPFSMDGQFVSLWDKVTKLRNNGKTQPRLPEHGCIARLGIMSPSPDHLAAPVMSNTLLHELFDETDYPVLLDCIERIILGQHIGNYHVVAHSQCAIIFIKLFTIIFHEHLHVSNDIRYLRRVNYHTHLPLFPSTGKYIIIHNIAASHMNKIHLTSPYGMCRFTHISGKRYAIPELIVSPRTLADSTPIHMKQVNNLDPPDDHLREAASIIIYDMLRLS